jgi:hypothetical protein
MERLIFTAKAQRTQSLFLFMFPAERPENIKIFVWGELKGFSNLENPCISI